MGVYPTLDVTRDDAIRAIQAELFSATDEQLSDMLFALFGERNLNNYRIVPMYDLDSWPYTWNTPYGRTEVEKVQVRE